ncbi:MAG: cytochrome c biogenesis CcdA family protein [Dehalococcoidia bacterium]
MDGLVGPILAVAAGAVSFFSPCVLPLVPVYLARLAGVAGADGEDASQRHLLLHAGSFVAGLALVFVALGASIGFIGFLLVDRVPLLLRLSGVMVIVFGLHMTGILRIPLLYRTVQPRGPAPSHRGYVASALIGGAFALGWTPCIGPVLGSILTLAASSATAAQGALLLLFYAAGLGVPFMIAAAAFGSFARITRRLGPRLPAIEAAGGLVLVAMGVLLVTDTFTRMNEYTARLGIGGL